MQNFIIWGGKKKRVNRTQELKESTVKIESRVAAWHWIPSCPPPISLSQDLQASSLPKHKTSSSSMCPLPILLLQQSMWEKQFEEGRAYFNPWVQGTICHREAVKARGTQGTCPSAGPSRSMNATAQTACSSLLGRAPRPGEQGQSWSR